MIWNTKQHNLTNKEVMISAHGFYPATILLIVCIPGYDPPPP